MHILLVEDTLIAQIATKALFIKLGHVVDTAIDGKSALAQTMGTHYDLILMDIGLGEGPDGFAVTGLIKQQGDLNKATPIIAVTAHNEPEYLEKAKLQGMTGYFTKPLTTRDAEEIVHYLQNPESIFITRGQMD